MKLTDLLAIYQQKMPENLLSQSDEQPLPTVHLNGQVASFSSLFIASYYKVFGKNHLVVLNNKEDAAYFLNDLQNLLPGKNILYLPDSFKRPGDFQHINNHNIRLRAEVLKNLHESKTRGEIIVTYPEALLEKVVDSRSLKTKSVSVKTDQKFDAEKALDLLVELGFEHTDFVYEPGQFSIRGGIIDIFSFGNEMPYRIELFDDEVESIREFDPISQISEKKISELRIIPNIQVEFKDESKVNFLSVLPSNTRLWLYDFSVTDGIMRSTEEVIKTVAANGFYDDEDEPLEVTVQDLFSSAEDICRSVTTYNVFEFGSKFLFEPGEEISFSIELQPTFNKKFDLLANTLKEYAAKGYDLYILSNNARQHDRLYHIFEDLEVNVVYNPIVATLHEGFIDHSNKILCFTDHQIFNRYHKYQLKKAYSKSQAVNLKALTELQPGDFVTHIDHGIGEFSGLQTIEVNGKKQESVRLKYRDGDVLYVGINSLYKIAKYTGKDGKHPRISKLGSDAWQNLKKRTKKKVKDIAEDLIKLYAKRKAVDGFAFAEDSYLQLELESSFMYEDTPDQTTATEAVKADMERSYPMDRLVCGDVGFGKTEVAMRAAFKAVADSKQVAVLVPTTILALQHYRTFKERFTEFPVNIDYINRFKSTAQKTKTYKALQEGKIDILIGTHALVNKKVQFKDLGLLIIDEEQKFGVSVKEKLRELKSNVDTLTLTATPIPRTLQFSLMGARDLSIMRTPPPNRQPITTEIKVFNEQFLKEAIEYEVYRGGQVFLVHNRVKDIMEYAGILNRILPDISVGVAHGQLEGKQLEDTVMSFIDKEFDVLLSTNIVENGLDIPNANTIIVNNAHMFGLSDLHQLRGRVGRSNKKAFCYLLSAPLSTLTQDARKRLKTLEQFSDLGSGFNIAMRDLDIRGAGNILGAEQSGFIADIGFDTFHKILDEAIQELKQTEFKEVFKEEIMRGDVIHVKDCQIDSDIDMRLPIEYVNSRAERLLLYQEFNKIENEEGLNKFGHELKDRFGPIPTETLELFDALRLQWLAKKIGFVRIILKHGKMRCFFIHNPDSPYFESEQFSRILNFIQTHPASCRLKQTDKNLSITFSEINGLHTALDRLQQITQFKPAKVSQT